jgi:hypothetical protein
MAKQRDEQEEMDREDAGARLSALVDAIEEERRLEEVVACCSLELNKAKSALKNAKRRRQELAFVERSRRAKS